MQVAISPGPIAIRQTCTVAFAGAAPQAGGTDYEARFINSIYKYVDPADFSLEDLDQGGLFDFGTENPPYIITEFRALATAGNVIISVEDRDGTHAVECYNGAGGYQPLTDPITVLPSQRIKLSTVAAGWIDLYVRKASIL